MHTLTPSDSSTSLHLLSLLLKCAHLVSSNNAASATDLLPEIFHLSSPFASSPADRIAAFFAHSLHSRLFLHFLSPPRHLLLKSITLSSQLKTFHSALQTFNSLAPFVKFSHFTANQAIFEAVHGFDRVHIIDLDVMQGLQWPGLFHILASRAKKVSSVRLTGFGPSSELLAQTGSRLAQFAASLGLPFKFNPVEGKFGDMSELELSRIDFRANEATVVHCMHHKLYDIIGSNFGLLRVLSTVKPKLVTMVTQNIDIFETGSFLERFIETLHYYSAMFDALGEGLSRDNVLRHQVEQQLFGSEIRNILACDDVDGLNVSRRWGDNLSRFGFEPVSLSGSPAAQASLLLEMFPWKGYTLMEENGCLRLGWKGMSLLTASAWQPSNYSCVTNNSNIMGN